MDGWMDGWMDGGMDVQPLTTSLTTFADMPRAGSGLISGCEEPSIHPM
jgi:hypothetical protein